MRLSTALASTSACKRVLCATDLTPRAQRALERAAWMARRLDAQLLVIHMMAADIPTGRRERARERLDQHVAALGRLAADTTEVELRVGKPVQAIAQLARKAKANLIVLGSHRRRTLAPLIGTTAERIIAGSRRPALIVNRESQSPYGEVLVAAEISDSLIEMVRIARSLRLLSEASLSIVHGFESPFHGPPYSHLIDAHKATGYVEHWKKRATQALLRRLDAAGTESSRFRIFLEQAKPLRALQRTAQRLEPELLITGTRARTTMSRLMRASVATDVVRNLDCDILAIPLLR